jgi:hypothetical protein
VKPAGAPRAVTTATGGIVERGGRVGNGGSASGGRVGNGGSASGGRVGSGGVGGVIALGGTAGGVAVGGTAPTCTDSDGSDARIRGETKGSVDGAFTDVCENGELIEYTCEIVVTANPDCTSTQAAPASGGAAELVAPPQCQVPTGKVVETQVDCDGRCREGTCFYWCPSVGDWLEYREAQGETVEFENPESEFRYECEVTFERDGYDCASQSLEGHAAPVISQGNCDLTSIVFGTATDEEPDVQTCTYSCSLLD